MMRKLMLFFFLGVFWFVSAAAGSWFFVNKQLSSRSDSTEITVPASAGLPEKAAASKVEAELPNAVRSRPMSPEEAFRFSASIRGEQELLAKREQRIEKEEAHLELIREDITLRKQEIDGLLAQVKETLDAGQDLLREIGAKRQLLDEAKQKAETQRKELDAVTTKLQDSEQTNLKQISRWFQSMPPEQAAEVLREISNDGKIDSVVHLLSNIEDRNVAKILEAVGDATLVGEILEHFTRLPRPPKTKRR